MYQAILRDSLSGKSKDVTQDCIKSTEYYWLEGNMSCDCNRAKYFDIPEDDRKCGDDRFLLEIKGNFPWQSEDE